MKLINNQLIRWFGPFNNNLKLFLLEQVMEYVCDGSGIGRQEPYTCPFVLAVYGDKAQIWYKTILNKYCIDEFGMYPVSIIPFHDIVRQQGKYSYALDWYYKALARIAFLEYAIKQLKNEK